MKILIALTYYRPHISGLTIYVERLARTLAARGHRVTVLTSHYRRDLPYREEMDGVTVLRHPVAFRFSKGSIMPGFLSRAWKLMREHDVASVHLPQAEGGPLAVIGRFLARTPVVLTYHCDLQLPPGILNRVIDRAVFVSNWIAARFADRIVAYTEDYARHSPLLSRFQEKIVVIYPPVIMPPPDPRAVTALKQRYHAEGQRIVGFAARFAEEKGVNYLINSIPFVREKIPNVKYLLAGEYENVIGENVWERLQPLIKQYREYLEFLGPLPNHEMGNFFGACDVLTVPSINSTESFGLVQVEAMLSGCPVVASNLPGVREPVRVTGMGEIVPIKDARALADAIVRVLQNRAAYIRPRADIEAMFALENTVRAYETLFESLRRRSQ
ncbi:MAG: glycosyltransferase family 4 protein [Anaerolineae bacterium]|nr:glycosyltransferase family 4 protein [Anaerolineae bacterium]